MARAVKLPGTVLDEILGVYGFAAEMDPEELGGVVRLSRVRTRVQLADLLGHCRKHGPARSQQKIALALVLRVIEERGGER
jgi:hypothetical protein